MLVASTLLMPGSPFWTVFVLASAAMLLRGCPMCWLLGLIERLRPHLQQG